MKSAPWRLRYVPLYAVGALALGAFIAGASIPARYDPATAGGDVSVPANWFVGGLQVAGAALLLGIAGVLAALVRFFAYRRIEQGAALGPGVSLIVSIGEVGFVYLAIRILWEATAPVYGIEPYGWLVYVGLTVLWLIVSASILLASAFVKPRTPVIEVPQ